MKVALALALVYFAAWSCGLLPWYVSPCLVFPALAVVLLWRASK